jgi:hypothetical protein
MDDSDASPDPGGDVWNRYDGAPWHSSELGGVVLRWPNLDVIFSYRGSVRSGTYLGGLQAVGATGVGHATVAGLLQTWASTGEGSMDRSVTEGGQTGVVSFVDGRGNDGSTREGLRQCGDGGERS